MYDGKYYSSIERGKAYDGTESLRDYYKKFTPVILYCFDEDVAYGDRGYSIDGEYKYVNVVPKRRIGKIEAMIHTHGNATLSGEEFFSIAVVGQDGQVIDKQYNDSGVAYMYRTYGFNAFNSDNPKEIHWIKNFVSYIVTPRGKLKKLTPKTVGEYDEDEIDNPFDDYYYRIPAYND